MSKPAMRPPTQPPPTAPPLTLAQNLEAEQSVLGAALMDEGALEIFLRECRSAHFHRNIHRMIYRAIVAAHQSENPTTVNGQTYRVDIVAVSDALKRTAQWDVDTPRYLVALLETCPCSALIRRHIAILHRCARLRYLAQLGERVARAAQCPDAEPDHICRAVERCLNQLDKNACCNVDRAFDAPTPA